jgi:hypothetical protein
MANFYGFPVLRWTLAYTEIVFVPVPSVIQEALIYLAGFFFTFIPALALTIYLMKKGRNWDLPFLWMCVAPGLSMQDFAHLGLMVNQYLPMIFSTVAVGSTTTMFVWFVKGEMKWRTNVSPK